VDDATAPRTFRVTLVTPEGPREFDCGENEYVLDAAESSGVRLPSICRQGRCLTCAGRLLAGELDETDASSYFPEDKAAGFVLLCRGKPRSDLRIRTHAEHEMRKHRVALGLPAPYG
jgi:ferredoxin